MSTFHVEIHLSNEFSCSNNDKKKLSYQLIKAIKQSRFISVPMAFPIPPALQKSIFSIEILSLSLSSLNLSQQVSKFGEDNNDEISIVFQHNFHQYEFKLHYFSLHEELSEEIVIKESEGLKGLRHWILPNIHFHNLWPSLIYENNNEVKKDLLNFLATTLYFSEKKVDSNTINWNKVILLYGPPGTGKTSLCKALAQKVTVRFSDVFTYGYLVEISAHSLFSKWFSESGKLVKKVFQKINELVEEEEAIVFVLIDEVESLAVTRKKSIDGNEPSDSIRAVNAFITQLDQLKYHDNVMILTTSNLENSVDMAFVDRADIKQYIGYPSVEVRYEILRDCLYELIKKNIILFEEKIPEYSDLLVLNAVNQDDKNVKMFIKLCEIAKICEKMSGRYLRKLPFLTHVYHFGKQSVHLSLFVVALEKTIMKSNSSKEKLFL